MIPQPPPGQGPIDPRGAFAPPGGQPPRPGMPPAMQPGMAPPGMIPPGMVPPGMMPPGNFPPPMMMPPFYPPPRRSFVGFVFRLFGALILILSLIVNFCVLIVWSSTATTLPAHQTVLVKGDSSDRIAVIPIEGVISEDTYKGFDKTMRELDDDTSIKGLVLAINTPGGEVPAADEIFNDVLRFKKKHDVKVVATMGGMATSGGYYVACSADYIFAEPTTLTGNIGVVLERFNFSGLMQKYGVTDNSITPTDAKFKNIESPFRPDSPEAQQYLRGLIDDTYAKFRTIVKDHRAGKLTESIETITDGRAFTANDAKKLGLIDEIDYADAAYAKAASLNTATKVHVVRYDRPGGWLSGIGAKFNAGAPSGGTNVSVDRGVIDQLTTPRMMSIYRGQ